MKYKKTLITTVAVGMLLSGSALAKAEPVSAEKNTGAAAVSSGFKQAPALAYNYYAGHPMYMSNGQLCTGGWTIYGGSGTFILTAGHCGGTGTVVSGTQLPFGTIAASRNGVPVGDSALVQYYPGVTPHQIVVNPLNGQTPGNGRVTAIMRNNKQKVNQAVGKMGATSGWTEGVIFDNITFKGKRAKLATFYTAPGDSGGPVWRYDTKLRAVGMIVGYLRDPVTGLPAGGGIYYTIQDLLTQWGANINTYAARGLNSAADDDDSETVDVEAELPEEFRELADKLKTASGRDIEEWAAENGYEIGY